MTITIHQPNFVPWYPYFQKIQQADVFVLLGHCQFEKNYINPLKDWNSIKSRLFEYKNILSEMDNLITDNLYETNKDIILYLMNKLNITTPLVEDYPTDLNSTERLVDLCKKYNATTYLAGQGGKEYLNKLLFEKEGIEVIYQENLNKIHTLEYLK